MPRPRALTIATVATALTAALPPLSAAAQAAPGGGDGDVVGPVIWSIVAALVGILILGILYLFKRQLGMFDDPDWIAPIGAVYSKDLPSEDEEDEHGGDEGHSAAH